MKDSLLQKDYFSKLFRYLPKNQKPSYWLMDILEISESSAYKKISGERLLTTDEISKLCNALPEALYSLPNLLGLDDAFAANFNTFTSRFDVGGFLQKTNNNLKRLAALPHCLNYVGRDMSFFLFMARPRLFTFKIALWTGQLYREGLKGINSELYALAKELFSTYLDLNSKELWFPLGMQNLRKQLDTSLRQKLINEEHYHLILQELVDVLNEFREYTIQGSKEKGNFDLLELPFCTMQNGGLFKAGEGRYLMSAAVDARHYVTQDKRLIAAFDESFQILAGYGISLKSVPHANSFFDEATCVFGADINQKTPKP